MKPLSDYDEELRDDIAIIRFLNSDLNNPKWQKPSDQKYGVDQVENRDQFQAKFGEKMARIDSTQR